MSGAGWKQRGRASGVSEFSGRVTGLWAADESSLPVERGAARRDLLMRAEPVKVCLGSQRDVLLVDLRR